ncbi:MAG: hypothetical protein ACRDOK_26675 [Streptosporangiaceae bacterium]
MEIRFTRAARRHRISRESVRYVMAACDPSTTTTRYGTPGWRYLGRDHAGRELEVIAVVATERGQDYLLVIHVMPAKGTRSKEGGRR